jgi:hypothetical protein
MKSLDLGDDCSHKLTMTIYRRFICRINYQHIFIIEEDMVMLFIRLLLFANKDLTQDTNFYVENPCGKNHGRQLTIFAIWREFTKCRGNNESFALPLRLTRCVYKIIFQYLCLDHPRHHPMWWIDENLLSRREKFSQAYAEFSYASHDL